jgi:signal transduction histidine kinase
VALPEPNELQLNGVLMSPIRVDDDLLPTTSFALHLKHLNQPAGWLVGEFSLEEMWRMVDRIHVGDTGFAMVVAPNGELVAHGDPDKKALVALATSMSAHPLMTALKPVKDDARVSLDYVDSDGRSNLGVATRIPSLGWTVIVEQPTAEAYATAAQLRAQLVATIVLALLVMAAAGYVFGRSLITPILTLTRATERVAAGDLQTRVDISTGDEFGKLGDAFNTMADRLVALQDDVKRQERQAMFGRIAAGLVHDLSHPVQNIGNSARLLARDDLDAESRDSFRRTVERELQALRRFMDDLRNVVRPKPVERFPMDVDTCLAEIVESTKPEAERQGVVVAANYLANGLVIDGDRFALGRVFRNLITNAIQATSEGGSVTVATAFREDQAEITVTDTGTGIPPERLSTIFDDFVTTKRRGLGLGLAISKNIVEQLGGTIGVVSSVGIGTQFTLRFPARLQNTAEAAAS